MLSLLSFIFHKLAVAYYILSEMIYFIINTSLTGWITYSLYTLIVILNLIFVVVIISENRNPVKSIAWILVLTLIPVIGFIFYLFFGRDQRSQRMISRKGKRKLQKLAERNSSDCNSNPMDMDSESIQQIKLGYNLTGAILTQNNRITIFNNGKDKFDSLFEDIRNAKSFIHLQYYIFANDKIGKELKTILKERSNNGVEVRILYDDVGCWSWKLGHHPFDDLCAANVQAKPFFKVTFPQLANKLNYRNHRKLAIIDGKIGYLGGMNIADRYRDGVSWGIWRDTHIKIEGPAVHELQSVFLVDWNFTTKELLSKQAYFPKIEKNDWKDSIQIITSGPLDENKAIEMMFLKAINSASKKIFLQTPYFLPSSEFIKSLIIAASSGVDVRIMIPERSDSPILQLASHSYISQMLRAGIKVFFYTAGFLHAKVIIIDDGFTTIGSTNFDFRSFEQNFELNAFIYSHSANVTNTEQFLEDQKSCYKVTPKGWEKRPVWKKIRESVSRLLSPVL